MKVGQIFCHPSRGFNMLMYPTQGFRCAPPPACHLIAPIGAYYNKCNDMRADPHSTESALEHRQGV